MIRYIVLSIFALSIAWGSYWFSGQAYHQSNVERRLQALKDDGWRAEYDQFAVKGFPNRFDLDFRELFVKPPEGMGTGSWYASHLQLLSLSYRPNHWIVAFDGHQIFEMDESRLKIEAEKLMLSALVDRYNRRDLKRAVFEGRKMKFSEATNPMMQIDGLDFALREHDGAERAKYGIGEGFKYDFAGSIDNLVIDEALYQAGIAPSALPPNISRAAFSAVAYFDRPLDIQDVAKMEAGATRLDLEKFELAWGDIEISLAGDLQIDEVGYPNGDLTLRIEDWRSLVELSLQAGFIDAEFEKTIEALLIAGSSLSGESDQTLDLDFTFKDQQVFMGRLPLGPAPKLRPSENP